MPYKKFGALSSSVDPEQLSATVSGAILSFSAIIIFVASQFFHVSLGSDQISQFASQVGIAVGALWFVFGLVRKLIVSIQQAWATYSANKMNTVTPQQ